MAAAGKEVTAQPAAEADKTTEKPDDSMGQTDDAAAASSAKQAEDAETAASSSKEQQEVTVSSPAANEEVQMTEQEDKEEVPTGLTRDEQRKADTELFAKLEKIQTTAITLPLYKNFDEQSFIWKYLQDAQNIEHYKPCSRIHFTNVTIQCQNDDTVNAWEAKMKLWTRNIDRSKEQIRFYESREEEELCAHEQLKSFPDATLMLYAAL
ncbi:MAG: hypothetical protein GY738_23255, partial [Pseudoalteromonas sp.]|nr:hypothetical protein [Pseudoalteromonas sp.]